MALACLLAIFVSWLAQPGSDQGTAATEDGPVNPLAGGVPGLDREAVGIGVQRGEAIGADRPGALGAGYHRPQRGAAVAHIQMGGAVDGPAALVIGAS